MYINILISYIYIKNHCDKARNKGNGYIQEDVRSCNDCKMQDTCTDHITIPDAEPSDKKYNPVLKDKTGMEVQVAVKICDLNGNTDAGCNTECLHNSTLSEKEPQFSETEYNGYAPGDILLNNVNSDAGLNGLDNTPAKKLPEQEIAHGDEIKRFINETVNKGINKPDRTGLLNYRNFWELVEVEILVNGKLITGIPIFVEDNTFRIINDKHSYFIPLKNVDYIRTNDGLRSSFDLPKEEKIGK